MIKENGNTETRQGDGAQRTFSRESVVASIQVGTVDTATAAAHETLTVAEAARDMRGIRQVNSREQQVNNHQIHSLSELAQEAIMSSKHLLATCDEAKLVARLKSLTQQDVVPGHFDTLLSKLSGVAGRQFDKMMTCRSKLCEQIPYTIDAISANVH